MEAAEASWSTAWRPCVALGWGGSWSSICKLVATKELGLSSFWGTSADTCSIRRHRRRTWNTQTDLMEKNSSDCRCECDLLHERVVVFGNLAAVQVATFAAADVVDGAVDHVIEIHASVYQLDHNGGVLNYGPVGGLRPSTHDLHQCLRCFRRIVSSIDRAASRQKLLDHIWSAPTNGYRQHRPQTVVGRVVVEARTFDESLQEVFKVSSVKANILLINPSMAGWMHAQSPLTYLTMISNTVSNKPWLGDRRVSAAPSCRRHLNASAFPCLTHLSKALQNKTNQISVTAERFLRVFLVVVSQ